MRTMNKTRLTEIFRLAGAPNPEGWAESEASEDIPQAVAKLLDVAEGIDRVVEVAAVVIAAE
jgi:hypothetical protein